MYTPHPCHTTTTPARRMLADCSDGTHPQACQGEERQPCVQHPSGRGVAPLQEQERRLRRGICRAGRSQVLCMQSCCLPCCFPLSALQAVHSTCQLTECCRLWLLCHALAQSIHRAAHQIDHIPAPASVLCGVQEVGNKAVAVAGQEVVHHALQPPAKTVQTATAINIPNRPPLPLCPRVTFLPQTHKGTCIKDAQSVPYMLACTDYRLAAY